MKAIFWLENRPSRIGFLLVVLIFIAMGIANGLVHKIPTQIHKLSPELSKLRLLQKYARNPEMLKLFSGAASLEVAEPDNNRSVPFSKSARDITVAQISVGTPPQKFNMEVDWFFDPNMELIDSNATYSSRLVDNGRSLFNSSLSSSYSQVDGSFIDIVSPSKGHRGNDIVNVNGQEFKLTFGVLDTVQYAYFESFEIDGILGLSPGDQRSAYSALRNLTTVVKQIVSQLDNSVISVWQNSSGDGDGTGQITLGALDTDHCESNWMFMPKTESSDSYTHWGYTVHLATMEATWTNGTQETFKANMDVAIVPDQNGIVVPKTWIPLFKNISKAVWNSEARRFEVDCDTTKLGNVTFRIGGHGYGQNSKTYNLTVTGADYSAYYEYYDICYLNVYDGPTANSQSSMPVILGHNFARDHCLAYNAKDNKIGIADSKTQNTRFIDYD